MKQARKHTRMKIKRTSNTFVNTRLLFLSVLMVLCSCANISGLSDSTVRSSGTIVDDQETETLIKRIIVAEGDKRPLRVRVKSFNRFVLLLGEVDSRTLSEHFEISTARIKGVRRVFNLIQVVTPLPTYKGLDDLLTQAQVSLRLSGVKELHEANIERLVDRSRVYLMGLVTPRQGELAVAAVRSINSVAEVIVLFEYIRS